MAKRYKRKVDEEGNEYFEEETGGLEVMESFGEAMQSCGSTMSSCGCLLTLFITIPILLLLFSLFF